VAEFSRWSGLIGHQHITASMVDPGPAFAWDLLLARARAALVEP